MKGAVQARRVPGEQITLDIHHSGWGSHLHSLVSPSQYWTHQSESCVWVLGIKLGGEVPGALQGALMTRALGHMVPFFRQDLEHNTAGSLP